MHGKWAVQALPQQAGREVPQQQGMPAFKFGAQTLAPGSYGGLPISSRA